MITESLYRGALLLLILAGLSPTATAETLLAEGMREIEEFRMRQLQTVQHGAEISPFATGERFAPELSLRYDVSGQTVRNAFASVASWMYRAVRIGGQPCSLLPWRWGYGWPNCAFAAAADAPPGVSEIKSDERVLFFNTAAWLDSENARWHIPQHAWIFEPQSSVLRVGAFAALLESEYGLVAGPDSQALFERRSNLLIADNERGKTLVVRIAGQDVSLPPSAENGHVNSVLQFPADLIDAISEQGYIRFHAVTRAGETRRFSGEVRLIPPVGISVISDIDDTIKTSHVTDRRRLIEQTFFKPFEAVPGMAALYRELASNGASLHFVSSSPWQLYEPLREFLDAAGFPWATLALKPIRFRDETLLNLFKPGTETKPAQILPLLQRFPGRRFILIGDSGEQDPEVYGDIARRYPQAIQRILIRRLNHAARDDPRYIEAFAGLPPEKWRLFDHPGQLSVDELMR